MGCLPKSERFPILCFKGKPGQGPANHSAKYYAPTLSQTANNLTVYNVCNVQKPVKILHCKIHFIFISANDQHVS